MSRGNYNTKQKQIILSYLIDNKDNHVTAEKIMECLKAEGTKVGKTTVYRYLNSLMDEGKVNKYHGVEGMPSCYQYIDTNTVKHHHHLVCSTCNKLLHIECEHLVSLEKHMLQEHNFKLDQLKTVYYGTCKECAV